MSEIAPPYPPGTLAGYQFANIVPPAGAYTVGSLSAARQLVRGRYILFGWCLHNAGAAAQTVDIYDSTSAAGTLIATGYAAAGNDDRYSPVNRGIEITTGIHLVPSGGPWTGSFFLIPYPFGA